MAAPARQPSSRSRWSSRTSTWRNAATNESAAGRGQSAVWTHCPLPTAHCPLERLMRLTLKVWRQKNTQDPGRFVEYDHPDVNEHMSFLEMLDVLNQRLIEEGRDEPIAFDHDCREGICGTCSLMIDGVAHGPERATTVC